MKENIEHLTNILKEYLDHDPTLSVDAKIIDILANRALSFIKRQKVLEMGVGVDKYTKYIIEKFGKSYIVDVSEILLNNSINKVNVVTYHSKFEDFTPDLQFKTIQATNILEHLEDRVKCLIRMDSWLENDGRIILIVPNANSVHRNLDVSMNYLKSIYESTSSDFRLDHKIVYYKKQLEKDIKESGLKILDVLPTFIKISSSAQMENFSDNQLNSMFVFADNNPIELSSSLFYILRKA